MNQLLDWAMAPTLSATHVCACLYAVSVRVREGHRAESSIYMGVRKHMWSWMGLWKGKCDSADE